MFSTERTKTTRKEQTLHGVVCPVNLFSFSHCRQPGGKVRKDKRNKKQQPDSLGEKCQSGGGVREHRRVVKKHAARALSRLSACACGKPREKRRKGKRRDTAKPTTPNKRAQFENRTLMKIRTGKAKTRRTIQKQAKTKANHTRSFLVRI